MDTARDHNPLVSIVIPYRNERGHIGACLVSTLKQYAPAGGFEVIVADGMSDDGTREILAQLAKEVVSPPTPLPLLRERVEMRASLRNLLLLPAPCSVLPRASFARRPV